MPRILYLNVRFKIERRLGVVLDVKTQFVANATREVNLKLSIEIKGRIATHIFWQSVVLGIRMGYAKS